jgi:hypothetical protein
VTKQQEFLLRACVAFGLKISIDHEVELASGHRVVAQAHIPDLGPHRGMLIFSSFDELSGAEKELVNSGYGYSVYGIPSPREEFDLESYAEMFVDWNGGQPLALKG